MENPAAIETEELYDENYYLSFHDGSLSKKLLSFSSYINRNRLDKNEIERKISKNLYNYPSSKSPIYYQENPKFFYNYAHSTIGRKNIEIFKNEISICFVKIINWSKQNNLKVLDENQEIVGVDNRLSLFRDRLENNEFSDKTYLFYGEEKKAIEIIALLIEDESIEKEYRKN